MGLNEDHKLIWLKIEHLEKFFSNHISTLAKNVNYLDKKIDNWMWKMVFLILGSILVPLTLIIALRALGAL